MAKIGFIGTFFFIMIYFYRKDVGGKYIWLKLDLSEWVIWDMQC